MLWTRFHLRKLLSKAVFLIVAVPQIALAGAWVLPEGELKLINNLFYYQSDSNFDLRGNKTRFENYRELLYNPWLEYGTGYYNSTALLSAGIKLFKNDNEPNSSTETELNHLAAGIRTPVYNRGTIIVSTENIFYYYPKNNYNIVDRTGDHLEIYNRVQVGYSFPLYDNWHFAEASFAYVARTDLDAYSNLSDMLLYEVKLGLRPHEKLTILTEIEHKDSLKNRSAFLTSGNYDLTRLQVSALYAIDDKYTIQLGYFEHLSGKIIGAGEGVAASLWVKF